MTNGCESGKQDDADSPPRQRSVSVTTFTAETGKIQEVVHAVGTMEAMKDVEIRPEISAIVEKIHFQEGAQVSAGELLFTLESDEIRRRLQSLQAQLDGAEAEAERARRFYQRRRELFSRNVISAETRDKALADYLSANSRVDQIEAQILEAKETLKKTRLASPIDGIAGAHRVDPGDYASVGDLLTTVFKIDRLSLSFTVPERFAGQVKPGQLARIELPSHPEKFYQGKIYYVSPQIVETTRSLPLKAWVENPDRTLLPGAYAAVELIIETRNNAVLIPEEALVPTRDGYGIFVVEDGMARWREVNIGLRRPGTVEIRQGLEPGEIVVRTGHINLADGDPVKVVSAP
ncbi:MAG: efflux RND transporter periplasmic adaptor subunit [Desulfobacterales bacterium]|nr:efflux RND transporter periplasmic adaptor subunit [Desulfobacterales bacterium]